ncbi:MAG: ABC transporter permease [Bacilli bacterium]|nr:ABC transporter permease [Bacilli bacterium]
MNKVKKNDLIFEILRTFSAIIISFIIAFIIILFTSKEPFSTIKIFITAPFASSYALGKILTEAVPLLFTGTAVCIMIKAGQFNMIGEGLFYIGGLIGAVIVINISLPPIILPLCALLLSFCLGGIVGYVPAKMKATLSINEFVSSLMFNFIIYWLGLYLLGNVFIDPNYSDIATHQIPAAGKLFFLSYDNQVSSSVLIGLLFSLLAWVFLYKTKWGYYIRMTGNNERFAHYSGIKTKRTIVYAQVIGAAICCLGGAAYVLGNMYRFNWKQLPNYGFDGFIIAIIAHNNPLLIPIAALFMGYLRSGAAEMARLTDVTNEVVFIIQAIMIILIAARAFLYQLKQKRIRAMVEMEIKPYD